MNIDYKVSKEIEDLRQQIAELVRRREDLQADSNKIMAGVEQRTRLISEMLVDGRDTTKEADSLVRDRTSLESLSQAIALINERIMDLDRKRIGTAAAHWRQERDIFAGEMDALLAGSIKKLYSAIGDLNMIKARYKDFDHRAVEVGLRTDENDHLRDIRKVCNDLLGYAGGGARATPGQIGIPFKLQRLEGRYHDLFMGLLKK
jgi:RNase H-fold protein (predicted Holliday junction resolvase)